MKIVVLYQSFKHTHSDDAMILFRFAGKKSESAVLKVQVLKVRKIVFSSYLNLIS